MRGNNQTKTTKSTSTMSVVRRSLLIIVVYLIPVLTGVVLATLGGWRETWYALRAIRVLARVFKTKSMPTPISEGPIANPWPEPRTDLFDDSRILWGYWKTGEETMPGFCQYAVDTWRVRNPEWSIVVLSDANFKTYVSASDLPTTYRSLKAQTLSDILPMAALIRYGGAYLDVSTVMIKGLDGIWSSVPENTLMLTPLVDLPDSSVFYNMALMFATSPGNPVFKEWLRRAKSYFEAPCNVREEMKTHPEFVRVAHMMDDPSVGVHRGITPYHATLWILTDIIMFDDSLEDYLKDHLVILPPLRWTFDFMTIPLLMRHVLSKENKTLDREQLSLAERYGDPSLDPPMDWAMLPFLRRSLTSFSVVTQDDPELAQDLVDKLVLLKSSSAVSIQFDKPKDFHPSQNNTFSRIHKAAIDPDFYPTVQATLAGSRKYRREDWTKTSKK